MNLLTVGGSLSSTGEDLSACFSLALLTIAAYESGLSVFAIAKARSIDGTLSSSVSGLIPKVSVTLIMY